MRGNDNEIIYLDNAATSPPAPEVIAAIDHALQHAFGNPSSGHREGLRAARLVREARQTVAMRFAVEPDQIVFTSGGTEALALGLLGAAARRKKAGHILVSTIEHAAVLETAELAARYGHSVGRVAVGSDGRVSPQAVADALRPETFLVAVMHVNNETGMIQPVEAIGATVKRTHPDCRLLVDAVQSFGLLDTQLDRLGADLLAASAHKLHGPKGVGCLALAKGQSLAALWGGGGQQRGLRTGTENVPGIAGFGAATALGKGELKALADMTRVLGDALCSTVEGAYALGSPDHRAPHIVAVALPGRRSDTVINALSARNLCLSSGSACHSRSTRQSHVLAAMGVPRDHGVIRISPSRLLSPLQIERAAEIVRDVVPKL